MFKFSYFIPICCVIPLYLSPYMNELGFISLNGRRFLTQLARKAYLSSSMNHAGESPTSDDKATEQLVRSL